MIKLELLEEKDFQKIIDWNLGKGPDFLYQWAGPGYDYPITVEKLKQRFAGGVNFIGSDTYIFKIVSTFSSDMIGTIELTKIDNERKFGVVGRFLIGDETRRGQGIGEVSLSLLSEIAFREFGLESLALKVFDFNVSAIRCYEKVGFRVSKYIKNVRQTDDSTWGVYEMTLTRSSWELVKKIKGAS